MSTVVDPANSHGSRPELQIFDERCKPQVRKLFFEIFTCHGARLEVIDRVVSKLRTLLKREGGLQMNDSDAGMLGAELDVLEQASRSRDADIQELVQTATNAVRTRVYLE